ncbi:MAG: hypothetical protein IJO77_03220 [Oscillospiraceae bacterium]|nr:hypothetical protein [Oscillospiraceae bacterium]
MFGFPNDTPEKMREIIEGYLKYITEERPDLPSAVFRPIVVECDPETPKLTVAYPIKEGMLNAIGNAHGAIISMAYDITMGIMARWHQHGTMSPTLTMGFEFLKAVPCGSTFVIEATAVASARHTVDFVAKGWIEGDSDTIVNRAEGRYFIYKAMEE